MPINYRLYPKNWRKISARVRDLAGNRCELCGAPNLTEVVRPTDGYRTWIPRCSPETDGMRLVRIVLTVHHIDGNRSNNSKHNLIALCQRCHLRLDRERHIRKRKNRRLGGEQMEVFNG